MKAGKKLVSLFLVLIMCFSIVPIEVSAAYENTYSNTGNQRNDIIGVAKTQVGYTEGSNDNNKYGAYFGANNVSWCAYFIVWCARQANIGSGIIKKTGWADADDLGVTYKARGSYTPQKGDIIIFDYVPRSTKTPASAYGDHVGLVESVSGGYVNTIEGNANGGVRRYSYSLSNSDIKGYGVPAYTSNVTYTVDKSFPSSFKCYIISTSNVKCYDSVNGSSIGYIYPEDDCVIKEVYTNGWVKCTCPWENNTTKTVYVKKTVFINSSESAVKMTAPKYAVTYISAKETSSWGWIDKGDTIYKVAVSGDRTQIIYPADSGLRCAWVKTSELHSHSYTSSVTKAATCTSTGIKTFKCSCGASYTETIAKTAHNSKTTIPAVDATCTKTGLTEGKKCSVCGTITVAQQTVAKKAHTYTSSVTTQPTCTKDGIKTYKCACGASYTEAIAKKAHTIVIDKAVSATCTKTGLTEGKHCSVCGTVTVAQQTVAKKAHTEVIDKAVAATCTKTGLTEGKHCSVCGTVIVAQQTVAAKGHKDANGDYKCDYGCGYEYEKPADPKPSDPTENCGCNCHKGGIAGFFFKIILFFQKLFKTNKVCACGVAHY